jgi:hypothetical protein
MAIAPTAPHSGGTWIENDVRRILGVFGRHATVYNVYSAGDSGEGCEVIEFTTPSPGGMVCWTARVSLESGRALTVCTVGW